MKNTKYIKIYIGGLCFSALLLFVNYKYNFNSYFSDDNYYSKILNLTDTSVEVIGGHAQGFIKDEFQTAFFKYSIDEVNFVNSYEGYKPDIYNQLIDASITFENTVGQSQPMWQNDFQIQWHNIEKDYSDGINYSYCKNMEYSETLLPEMFIQNPNQKDTFHLLYEVPLEADYFSISYLERFEDGTEFGREGNTFWTYFKKI